LWWNGIWVRRGKPGRVDRQQQWHGVVWQAWLAVTAMVGEGLTLLFVEVLHLGLAIILSRIV
jgi:hypothetical protein